jgi:transposase-like protein
LSQFIEPLVLAPEFKFILSCAEGRETVALLESSGRPFSQVAAEIGIMRSMLRAWRRSIQSGTLSQAAAAGKISRLRTSLCFLKNPDNLFVRKLNPLHLSILP